MKARSKSVKVKRKPAPVRSQSRAESRKVTSSTQFSALLETTLNSVDEGILIVDSSGCIIFHNKKFLTQWGVPQSLLRQKNDQAILKHVSSQVEEDSDPLQASMKVKGKSTKKESLDQIRLKDGRTFRRLSRPHSQGKKIVGRVWSFRDVTEEVKREAALTELKNRHELVVASFGRVVYDYDLVTGKVIWSGNVENVLGYFPHEMGLGNAWAEFIHEEDRQHTYDTLIQAKDSLSRYEVVYRCKTKVNGYAWIRDSGFFIGDQNNIAHRMVGEMEDITRQVQTEKEIRHLASFPLHNPEIVIEIKRDLSLNYANPSFYEAIRRLGLTDHYPFVAKEVMEMTELTNPWKIAVDVHVSGRIFNEKIYFLAEKEVIRIYAYDNTERIEAEKRISDLELTYKTLFESATDCILIIDLDENPGKIISANPAAASIYGYSLHEFLQLNLKDVDSHPQIGISFEERANQLKELGRQNFEVVHYHKDGSHIPLEVVATVIDVSEKKYLLAIERDISLRKKAEEEIQLQYRFIESLAAASPDIVYVYDIDSDKYVYANQNMADSYGYSIERLQAEGHKLMVLSLSPEDVAQIPDWIDLVKNARDNEVIETQFRLRTPDGIWRTFRCRESVFLRDDQNRVKQIIGSAHDITDKVAAESALRESEERFRTLHEAIFAGIAIHDKGIIMECNKGLSDLSGYSYSELIGLNGMEIVHPDDRPTVMQRMQGGDETPYDIRGLRKDGTIIELEIHGKSIPYKGRILRITEFRDITERKKVAEKILEQNARLQAITDDLKFKNEQLDEFTQIVSHNLRAPAGNIVSLTKFLQDPNYSGDHQEILNLLKDSGDIILNTLAELNEVLKIKQNKNIEKQELFFESVLLKVKNMMNVHIADTGASIERDFREAQSVVYPNIYLESIILNLLSNALKYKHPGRSPHIKFTSRQENGSIILEVSDNGLGIDLDRYGHQVFKLRKTFHQHPDSRGIGLFMIKNQVESLGGKVGVISAEGVGSTFTIIF
jgi:PAS domain S-box-containing protein